VYRVEGDRPNEAALIAERFSNSHRQVASIARKSFSIVHLAESRSFLEGKPH
jgi:hypothetical protein